MSNDELKALLEEMHDHYNRREFIENDPISVPHLFSQKEDIEIVGFLTASISWGTRKSIIANARELMRRMDFAPFGFVKGFSNHELEIFGQFVHRTFNGSDCVYFLKSIRNIYSAHGGFENVFTQPVINGLSLKESIIYFRKIFFELPYPEHALKHIANPEKNASCKRINMFLRWMVRHDNRGVDFGLWKQIKPRMLYCPLDVHTGNVARKLGLLRRKANDWKSVEELTGRLKLFDPNDPVKYDFALFGTGIYETF
jgi:uncharacterized protein (TIGR02757 family)